MTTTEREWLENEGNPASCPGTNSRAYPLADGTVVCSRCDTAVPHTEKVEDGFCVTVPAHQPAAVEQGLTTAEYWAALDRELERMVHGGHEAVSTMAEERFLGFDSDGSGL